MKGSFGKTLTRFRMAGALARLGKSALLVDLDPQASLTQGFFGPEASAEIAPEVSAAALLGEPHALPFPGAEVLFPGVGQVPGQVAAGDLDAVPVEPPRAGRAGSQPPRSPGENFTEPGLMSV